ncbi:MAG TPA: protease complex subunit PrcB family protein [Lutibacter sp.]|nr:protease complex subunit PrcB family protein [Lutibacter sp.]
MNFKNSILFLVVLTFLSCTSKKQIISFTEIAKGGHSNVENAKLVVINDLSNYNEIFSTINETREPNLEIPAIDFDNEMGIGLFMGLKNSGGYSIQIDSIVSKPKELVIFVKESKPKGRRATSVMTQPFYIAKIKKTSKKIIFR